MLKPISKLKYKRLLKKLNISKLWRDDVEEEEWLIAQWEKPGFKSYIAVRNIEILKSIAEAVRTRDFHNALELSGRRLETLRMAERAKRAWLKEDNK